MEFTLIQRAQALYEVVHQHENVTSWRELSLFERDAWFQLLRQIDAIERSCPDCGFESCVCYQTRH